MAARADASEACAELSAEFSEAICADSAVALWRSGETNRSHTAPASTRAATPAAISLSIGLIGSPGFPCGRVGQARGARAARARGRSRRNLLVRHRVVLDVIEGQVEGDECARSAPLHGGARTPRVGRL